FGAWALDCGSSIPSNSAGAPPNNSANGPTNPIVPPHPIATGSRSYPCRMAASAASNAGPFGSVIHHDTSPIGLTVTFAPHGGSLVRKAVTCSSTFFGSMSGTIRHDTIAAAFGSTWLDADLIELASWA